MLVDFNIWMAKAKVFPGTTAFALGDVIDLKKTGLDQTTAEGQMWVVLRVTTAFTGTTTAMSIDLVSSDTNPNGAAAWTSPTVHLTGTAYATIGATPAVGGDWQIFKLPRGTYKRYLGLRANYATAAPTTGAIDGYLIDSVRLGQIPAQGIVGP